MGEATETEDCGQFAVVTVKHFKLIKIIIILFKSLSFEFFDIQNYLLNYCSHFCLTFLFQLIVKSICLIFFWILLILDKEITTQNFDDNDLERS